ncbi:flagellar basal body-associated protein FliL [Thermosipho africanus TCF52B]|jgi:flagellar FliL protein|uniref:Flagellar protein FliL n=1 Tax=Thermosipho africanus (strain TCF52B) TaxID=484019 RepID=B7IDJ9_THEAB|nr:MULTISPECIES: flagellar basal body-associated FliL family protein [Thermosipho]ACJ76076.1 flagellar basal body-associated protein FliL [Thermosipho africanus TCF52B]MBZ4649729.1 fliL [Thermosipho sp. (in: thermotogales)]MDK2839319.1 flagellar protein FliL [Thermosipho sp. (in: thermotogales)]MDK2900694.1 flagellar protein FliL [Thermosipho sp. (in: thermotogales)]
MPEEEIQEGQQPKKKKGIMGLLGPILIPLVISLVVSVAVVMFLGNNTQVQTQKTTTTTTTTAVPIKAVVIQTGTYQTFMLKGGKEVAVIDSLSFKVGSDQCRSLIAEKNDEIMDALMLIFLSKERTEINTPAGIELLKKQIKNAVNEITGFVGEKEKEGVIDVYLYIKAVSSVQ